jgi:mannosyltransferase OCH1-like enzyme
MVLQGPYFYSHFSDAFRVCVLWRWGGHYLDTDVLLLRPLTAIRNALGAEALRRSPEQSWAECLRGVDPPMDELYDVNLAVASFDPRHPFLYYVMRRLTQSYDPLVWNSAGPGLVRVCLGEWEAMYRGLVQTAPSPPGPRAPLGAAVTVFTDPMVYYPVCGTL